MDRDDLRAWVIGSLLSLLVVAPIIYAVFLGLKDQ